MAILIPPDRKELNSLSSRPHTGSTDRVSLDGPNHHPAVRILFETNRVGRNNSSAYDVLYLNREKICSESTSSIVRHWANKLKGPGDGRFWKRERTVVVSDLSAEQKEKPWERIKFGGTLRHEDAHAQGANELEARQKERDYLRRFGLNGPSDKQIFLAMGGYILREGLGEFRKAEQNAYGNTHNLLLTFSRLVGTLLGEGQYSVRKDWDKINNNRDVTSD